MFYQKKKLLEKAVTMKRFEYPLLSKELKAQTDIAKKQYQGSNEFSKFDEKEEPVRTKKEKPTIKKFNKSGLIYKTNHQILS